MNIDIYEGDWKDGELHGQGKKTCKNGEVWIGCFKSDTIASGWITVHKKYSEPLYRGHTETVTPEGEHKITWTRKLYGN